MKLRYRYRIYPNAPQQERLAQLFGCMRVVKNIKAAGHAVRRGANVRPRKGAVCDETSIHLEVKQLELFAC